uniref:Small ribosomal subunit protein uS4c n=4 Tax=Equisetum TaxID=3257 RepID=RR4_EQUGI|nr:ribosomal protein S4 [Equisetum xylochaetum]Q6H9L2.1 RecName: Full=Small ribosomal subunit protein uS4c; AltName: Full=30S ribosomal protein S4, chloroplastic [Equisetum giganteum]UVF28143.1 ribosomal protein S4 [Equisetum xylochaetum]CAE47535.1 small ribosomal protein 4 [Equisetum giganteum]
MSRYRGPRLRIIRRLQNLPGLTNKLVESKKNKVSGSDQSIQKKVSQYGIRLEAKQRLRFNYGLTERQLLNYVRIARCAKGSTGQILLQLLEMRLDNILFRLGFVPTIPSARQLINHRHILVNNRIVDVPSFHCKPKDIITIGAPKTYQSILSKRIESFAKDQIPEHLTLSLSEPKKPKGFVNYLINRESIGLKINELLVVEYYSRKA